MYSLYQGHPKKVGAKYLGVFGMDMVSCSDKNVYILQCCFFLEKMHH